MAKNETMILVPCPVCKKPSKLRHVVSSPFTEHVEKYEIRKCTVCEHSFAEGRSDSEFLTAVYSQDFHLTAQQDAPLGAKGELPENLDLYPILANATQRVTWLLKKGLIGLLLDVGAGRGFFLQVAKNSFDVSGVELSESAAREAQATGLKMFAGDFLAFDSPASFNVITFWDVLAGFPSPLAALKHVRHTLTPDGYCVLTLPMGDSLAAKWMGRYWPFWIPPVNLHYFSKESLRRACLVAGLEIVSIDFLGKRVALSFIWLKFLRMLGLGNIRLLRSVVTSRRSIQLNFHDVATIILKQVEVAK
jgi:SAM-dependent methyltransferase